MPEPRGFSPTDAPSPPRASLVLAALAPAVLAGWLVLYSTAPYGPIGGTWSMHQLAAAEGLVSGRGMALSREGDFTLWAPLNIWLLAGLKLLGVRFAQGARWLDALAAFVVVFFHTQLLLHFSRSAVLALAGAGLLLASPQFMLYFASIRTEPVFLAFELAVVWSTLRVLERASPGNFALLTLFAALACLQRYTGVILVGCAAALLLFVPSERERRSRLRTAALFAGLSLLPLCGWILRNVRASGTLTGERALAQLPPWTPLYDAASTFAGWVTPWIPRGTFRSALALALGVLALAAVVHRIAAARDRAERRRFVAYCAFPLSYTACVIAIAALVELDPLGDRLLLPAWPFAFAFIVLGMQDFVAWAARRGRWTELVARGAALFFFTLVLAQGARALQATVERMRTQGGGGLSNPSWVESELARWLREQPLEGDVYSNLPEFVLAATDHSALFFKRRDLPSILERIREPRTAAWLVWVDLQGSKQDPTEAWEGTEVELVAKLRDGAVYRLGPRSDR